jgi:ketosteroid isomerase-like protein
VSDVEAIEAANAEFYAAIEAGDVTRIEQVWDDADDVVCVHPGWPAVRGRSRVLRSYSAIMANTAYIQFFGTGVEVDLAGDIAVVTCEHSLLTRVSDAIVDEDGGLGETARVVATNVFRRRPAGWRLWTHHGSPIMATQDEPG